MFCVCWDGNEIVIKGSLWWEGEDECMGYFKEFLYIIFFMVVIFVGGIGGVSKVVFILYDI